MAKKPEANTRVHYVWGLTRISLGFTFLWAFFDKLIGLGYATCQNAETGETVVRCSSAWLEGGSPTAGFLQFATDGPFAEFYQGLAGNPLTDWLFMMGLLGIGLALTLGIGMRIAVVSGVTLLMMMWSAALPPENNPIIDQHIVYSLVLIGLLMVNKSQKLGFGSSWNKTTIVRRLPFLA